jgi:hypothetical protein
MITLTTFGRFPSETSLTFSPFFNFSMPTFKHSLDSRGSLFKLTMDANLIMSLFVHFFLLTAYSSGSLVRTRPSKTARPSVFYAPLMTVCALFFFTVQLHLSFGRRLFPRRPTSSTGGRVVLLEPRRPMSSSSARLLSTTSCACSALCASPT